MRSRKTRTATLACGVAVATATAMVLAPQAMASRSVGWYGAGGSCYNAGTAVYLTNTSNQVVGVTCQEPTDFYQAQTRVTATTGGSWTVIAQNKWNNRTDLSTSLQTSIPSYTERNYFGATTNAECATYQAVSRIAAAGYNNTVWGQQWTNC